jgi:hypothetical protein
MGEMSPFPNGYINWLLVALAMIVIIALFFSGVLR